MTISPSSLPNSRILWLAGILLGILLASPVLADSYTWTGAADNEWANAGNWTPSGFPSSGTVNVMFDGAGSGNTMIDINGGPSVDSMIFDSAGVAAYTLGTAGQTLYLGSGADYTGDSSIVLNAGVTSNQTILANLHYNPSKEKSGWVTMTNNSSAALDIAGSTLIFRPETYAEKLRISSTGTGVTTISSSIQGVGGPTDSNLTLYTNVWGSGTVQLLGLNDFYGMLYHYAGTLVVNSLKNINQPSSVGSSGNMQLGITGDATLRYIGPDTSSNIVWATGDGANATTLTIDVPSSTLVLTGSCAQGYGLTKTGAGTLVLNSADNKYDGPTIISEGVLSVVTVGNGSQSSSIGKSSSDASNLVFDGGTLQYANTSVLGLTNRNFSITDGKMAVFDTPYSTGMTISGNVGPTTGGIQLTGGSLLLSGYNQYTGPTVVSGSMTNRSRLR